MFTSEKGLALIKDFEALALEAYQCPAGVWTIGYGHTAKVQPGECITADQADELLLQDVEVAEQVINQQVSVVLTQNQFDALVSFVFNIGGERFFYSTLLKKLNSGDYNCSADELLRWSHAGGKYFPGLARRRTAEKNLFLLRE